jgi:hypothetical protein
MKKLLIVLLVTLMISISAVPAAAAPQTQARYVPEGVEYIDAQVQVFIEHLTAFQAAYLAEHGQYYQALQSHNTAPDMLTPPDGLENHPTYQDDDLGVLWTSAALPYELAWSFSVNIYEGPDGQGYVLNVTTILDGHEYGLSANFGPETYRSQDWHEVTNPLPEG